MPGSHLHTCYLSTVSSVSPVTKPLTNKQTNKPYRINYNKQYQVLTKKHFPSRRGDNLRHAHPFFLAGNHANLSQIPSQQATTSHLVSFHDAWQHDGLVHSAVSQACLVVRPAMRGFHRGGLVAKWPSQAAVASTWMLQPLCWWEYSYKSDLLIFQRLSMSSIQPCSCTFPPHQLMTESFMHNKTEKDFLLKY